MPFKIYKEEITLADGSVIQLESGKLARLAHGAALLKKDNMMILATLAREEQTENLGFLPLSVDYQEKYAAAGKIPGSFPRREGKLSDHEILVSRLVDRAIRPCFPKNYFDNLQVRVTLLSSDDEFAPDPLVALAASTALMLSPVPFHEPISEVRVARIDGEFVINPKTEALSNADMEIIVAATQDRILMIEGEMKEVDEEDLIQAIQFAHVEIKKHCEAQIRLAQKQGIIKEQIPAEEASLSLEKYKKAFYKPLYEVAKQAIGSKGERKKAFKQVLEDYMANIEGEVTEEEELEIKKHFNEIKNSAIRNLLIEEKRRIDGRAPEDIREIVVEIDNLPSAHGSALFTRGETQALASVTLGSKQDEQLIDGVTKSGYNKVMLHYDFPGFSTGEVKPNRGPSRREIGHGNLALRALRPLLPSTEDNPYTMRIHSTILSSNGSSSMATVCGSSLALMDAGIQMPKSVAGIAMGLIVDPESGKNIVLSDILGEEDQVGDMDFKVTGTKDGMTACQMDIKVSGLSYEVLRDALKQAREGRLHIIDTMEKVIDEPRADLKSHVPRIQTFKIPRDTIGGVIGSGGSVIKDIQRKTGVNINVVEESNQGIVTIFSPNKEALAQAKNIIDGIVKGPEIGQVYTGKIKSIQAYGAFVEFIYGIDGLLHISQVTNKHLTEKEMREILSVDQEIPVKLTEAKGGRYSLSALIGENRAEEGRATEDSNRN
ncbi:MAG: polyribonucleotide nucleotidyltransferase [Bacteroidota bacterium]